MPNLYALTIEAQEVDGELAIALDKASSPDPEEQAEAEQLITGLLERANTSQALLKQKANAICHVREALLGKAKYLRETAAERIAKAEAEEKAAERLLTFLVRCLTALNPGQSSFSLPEYTLKSRKNPPKVDAKDDLLPPAFRRHELRIKLQSGEKNAEVADQLLAVVTETVRDLYSLDGSQYDIKLDSNADKTAIKAAIQAGQQVEGASLIQSTTWSIK